MNMRKKLLVGFLIVAVTTAVVGVTGIFGLKNLWENELGLNVTATNCVHAKELEANLSLQRALYGLAMITIAEGGTIDSYVEQIGQLHAQCLAEIEFLQGNLRNAEPIALIGEIGALYSGEYAPLRDQVVSAMQRGDEAFAQEHRASLAEYVARMQVMTTELSQQGAEQMELVTERDRQSASILVALMAGISALSVVVAVLMGSYISRSISGPVRKLVAAARKLTVGDIGIELDFRSGDELGELAHEFRKMIRSIGEQADLLQALAKGDYTVQVPVRSQQDVMNRALRTLVESSNDILQQVHAASNQVATGSGQIAQGAQQLATGATGQAASVDVFSSMLLQLRSRTDGNADNAKKALETTVEVGDLIQASTGYMQQMLEAMRSINESADNITRVIKVIEDIAFQTNILSLNAAVEAARAGQYGKGFAVVADEVRGLASKSAAAARETAALIEGSTRRVEQGNAVVQLTSESLRSVSEISSRNLRLIEEIAGDSAKQADAMKKMQEDIEQISKVVQSNSSTAEQSAAAAEEMAGQAALLQELVRRFRLGEVAAPAFHGPETRERPPEDGAYSRSFTLEYDKY